jgi:hypothetical protein
MKDRAFHPPFWDSGAGFEPGKAGALFEALQRLR